MARTLQTTRTTYTRKVPKRYQPNRINLRSQRLRERKPENGESQSEEQFDFQQFSLRFDNQHTSQSTHYQFPVIRCIGCAAVLTAQSTVSNLLESNELLWICEFCRCRNRLPTTVRIPNDANPCYIVEKAEQKTFSQGMTLEKTVVFCIDTSISMGKTIDGTSRLSSIKEALIRQLHSIKDEGLKAHLSLITFGSVVTVYTLNGYFHLNCDTYGDFDAVIQEASLVDEFRFDLQNEMDRLAQRINSINANGLTALGPALLTSIELASKFSSESKVILCTDGEGRVGIGGVNQFFAQSNKLQENFYAKVSQRAIEKRVQISVLYLKGDKCNLNKLGELCLSTGGSLLRIQPRLLGQECGKIFKDKLIGSQAEVTVRVNRLFRMEQLRDCECDGYMSLMRHRIGSFTAATELTYSFKLVSDRHIQTYPEISPELLQESKLPIQVEVLYLGLCRNRFLQVITDWRSLTKERQHVFDEINVGVYGAACVQRTSWFIKQGKLDKAQATINRYIMQSALPQMRRTQDSEVLEKYHQKMSRLKSILNSRLRKVHNSNIQPTRKGRSVQAEEIDTDEEQGELVALIATSS